MREDRSWVAPLAFCTFGGILVASIFSFLKLEDLLLSERGAALVSWLTLVVTTCAFATALIAVFIALRQIVFSDTQEIQNKRKKLVSEAEALSNFMEIVRAISKIADTFLKELETTENGFLLPNELVDAMKKAKTLLKILPTLNANYLKATGRDTAKICRDMVKMCLLAADAINDKKVSAEVKQEWTELATEIIEKAEKVSEGTQKEHKRVIHEIWKLDNS